MKYPRKWREQDKQEEDVGSLRADSRRKHMEQLEREKENSRLDAKRRLQEYEEFQRQTRKPIS